MAAQLAALRKAPVLRPSSQTFGLVALCLRSVLDDVSARLDPMMQADSDGSEGQEKQHRLMVALTVDTAVLDEHYVELCCPALSDARRVLQV